MSTGKTPEKIRIVKTDAPCTNPRIGRLVVDYLDKNLSPADEIKFEQHTRECLACSATLINAWELRYAVVHS